VIKLPDQTREQQIATFGSFCSPELLDKMIHAMKIAEDTIQTLEQILTTVEIYLKERRNVALDCLPLVNRMQQEGEVFEDFNVALCVAAQDADLQGMDYKAWMNTLLTVGITEDETRQKLLANTPSPTMDQTLTLCRNEEKGRLGQGDLRDPKAMVAETKFVPRKFSKFMGDRGRSRSTSHSREHLDKCKYCGYSHGKGECRAKGQKCNKCNKMNHFARCCTERDRQGQNAVIIAACREDKEPTVPLNLYKCGTSDFLTCASPCRTQELRALWPTASCWMTSTWIYATSTSPNTRRLWASTALIYTQWLVSPWTSSSPAGGQWRRSRSAWMCPSYISC
jgi:hypothetical protein